MVYSSKLMKKLNLTSKSKTSAERRDEGDIADMMLDPRYLRQSSALINEALQKGFDVLQLADGDIVTTGTKTVVYQYKWDPEKGKLVKTKTSDSAMRKSRRPMVEEEQELEEEEDA